MKHPIKLADLAECCQLSGRRIRQIIEGKASIERGVVDLAGAMPLILDSYRQRAEKKTLADARLEKLRLDCQLREHDLACKRAEMLPASDVKRVWEMGFHVLSQTIGTFDLPEADRQRLVDALRDAAGSVGTLLQQQDAAAAVDNLPINEG